MSSKSKGQGREGPSREIVVFGLDDTGKPKGARFSAKHGDQASQAAKSMKLETFEADTDAMKELAKKLPSGRIYAKGRAFVPFIKRDLYDKLYVASGGPVRDDTISSTWPADELAKAGKQQRSSSGAQPVVVGLPRYWDSIGPGHLVLVHDGPGEGWWESVVVTRDDQMLTLKYRDYPQQKQFERHISTVALINPGPE